MTEVIRQPTEQDRSRIDPEGFKVDKFLEDKKPGQNPEDKFRNEVGREFAKSVQKGEPFCDRAAMQDYKDHFEEQKRKILRKYGEVKQEYLSEIAAFNPDWDTYRNPKNFKLISEEEKLDKDLTKRNPGVSIFRNIKTYQWKFGSWKDIIIEPEAESIRRAKEKLK